MNRISPSRKISLLRVVVALAASATSSGLQGAPMGYVTQTISLNAPPIGLAYDAAGVLFAMEEPGFGNNVATVRTILPNGSFDASFSVTSDDPENFFTGGMTYDHVADRLLITDNTADGRLYAVEKNGAQQTLAFNLPAIAGVAVRGTGEIFVSTALGNGSGGVYQIDRVTGAAVLVLGGLDFGAGLAFDPAGDLVVQDAASAAPYLGRLQRLPIAETPGGLVFGAATTIISGATAAAGVLVDGAGNLFTTGSGGIYRIEGEPAVETLFYNNGNPFQFATAIALSRGDAAFEPFAGGVGGYVAAMADYGFVLEESFITLFASAAAEDFNSDGIVDGDDLAVWTGAYGSPADSPAQGDANRDGVVDGADFLQWQRAVGASTLLPVAEAAGGGQSVPEPLALLLLCLAAPLLPSVRRRRGAG